MSNVRTFEDLIAWQRAMDLAEHIYTMSFAGPIARDYAFATQIRRAAISVPSNTAEGFERGSRAEFHHFLSIAKGSCGEVRTQIELARRIGYISEDAAGELAREANSVSRIVGKLRASVGEQRRTSLVPRASSLVP